MVVIIIVGVVRKVSSKKREKLIVTYRKNQQSPLTERLSLRDEKDRNTIVFFTSLKHPHKTENYCVLQPKFLRKPEKNLHIFIVSLTIECLLILINDISRQ